MDALKNECVPSCPVGHTSNPVSNICQECQKGCSACLSTAEDCSNCKNGFYSKAPKKCIECENSCKTCSKGDSCDSCKDGYEFNSESSFCSIKQNCHSSCDGCEEGNTSNCLDCQNAEDYFYQEEVKRCLSNMCSGKKCRDDQCPDGYFIEKDKTVKNGVKKCGKCHTDCIKCHTSPNTCTVCSEGLILDGSKCTDQCSEGRGKVEVVPGQAECKDCKIEDCKICENGLDQCQKCIDGFTLHIKEGRQECVCPLGTTQEMSVGGRKICIPCGIKDCAVCAAPTKDTECEACSQSSTNIYLSKNKFSGIGKDRCLAKCPLSTQTYTKKAENGKSASHCVKCTIQDCSHCDEFEPICQKCRPGFEITDKGTCQKITACGINQFQDDNNQCFDCHESCAGCKGGGKYDCLSCTENFKYRLFQDDKIFECLERCPENTFYVKNANVCLSCPRINSQTHPLKRTCKGCRVMSEAKEGDFNLCESCYDGWAHLEKKRCQKSCSFSAITFKMSKPGKKIQTQRLISKNSSTLAFSNQREIKDKERSIGKC